MDIPGTETLYEEPTGIFYDGEELVAKVMRTRAGKYMLVLGNSKGGPILSGEDLYKLKCDFIDALCQGLWMTMLRKMSERKSEEGSENVDAIVREEMGRYRELA